MPPTTASTDPSRITRRYLRGWFAIDAVTAIPLAAMNRELRTFALVRPMRVHPDDVVVLDLAVAAGASVVARPEAVR